MGTNQGLYHSWKTWTAGGSTNGWENLGGYLTSSPGATAWVDTLNHHRIDVFVRGGDYDFTIVWQRSYNSGVWADWTPVGGV